jgi:exodeoxyribonuclease VII large subunit
VGINLVPESISSKIRDIYTVTRLNREVRAVLEDSFPVIWVQGEISNLAQPASGHIYFTLKDRSSQVRCAMFKNRKIFLKFLPENGMAVILKANISLYEGRGEFQIIVEAMEPEGVGALQLAFEQLKGRLQKEGLFDEQNKKPLPLFPDSIGVITSPTGAAIRDILNVLKRRFPLSNVVIYPVAVQGADATGMIENSIQTANRRNDCDVIILARGGGSLEDLWSFNEEKVARAIFDSTIPIVSGVGHEIDFTIADFLADKRAPTPSAAAELVSPDQNSLLESTELIKDRLVLSINHQINSLRSQINNYKKSIIDPVKHFQHHSQRLDDFATRIQRSVSNSFALKQSIIKKLRAEIYQFNPIMILKLQNEKCQYLDKQLQMVMFSKLKMVSEKIERAGNTLHTVSPLATLERGYSIVTNVENSNIINHIENVSIGTKTKTEIKNGIYYSKITKVEKK